MNFNYSNLTTQAWVVQTVLATFFTAGFLSLDMYLWQNSFSAISHPRQQLDRVLLTVVPIVLGGVMFYGGVIGFMDTMMFTNISLFVLVMALFDMQISLGEYLLRVAAVLVVWGLRHAAAPTAWTGVTVAVLIGIMIGLRLTQSHTQARARTMFVVAVFVAVAFWFTLPPLSLGLRVDPRLAGQAAAMFIVMAALTDYFWSRQRQQAQQQQQLQELAGYDDLTNVDQYAHEQADISALFDQAQAQQQPLTLAALDIDRLRLVNTDYGHLAGNAVLIQAADLLLQVLRQAGLAEHFYRTGGEEFNIALPNMTPDQAVPILRDCWQAVHDAQFNYEGQPLNVTVSIGATAVVPGDSGVADLYKRADDNLYQAKQRGRDTIIVNSAAMADRTPHKAPQYAFYTQPINDTSGAQAQVWGSELLLRQYDATKARWVLPAAFDLAVDQQVQLIYQAVAHSACKNVAINLTLAQFSDTQTAHALIACLHAEQGPSALTVEIVDVPDLATTRRISALYRAAGIRIHIDDVGSDNSYELVRRLLPYVDGVKFAIQNLRKTESMPRLRERIRFWAEVANHNHLRFILEGVEDETDIRFATDLGIHYFQGYYYAKPALPSAA
ncbi:diguanylate cyclase domain-containing protein [Lacticaseibacillus jixiensis]|uniref:diguanylate cyclase domain-containing protein n=1 Tax=Lacticaseibacillus jixiensis TaxID=3231926 RepID=UPI0036F24756